MPKKRRRARFPKLLEKRLKKLLGEEYSDFLHSLSLPLPRSVRLHPYKKPGKYGFQLKKPVSWWSNAYYLEEEFKFGEDPLWYAGCYYVQTASSMAIAPVVQWALDNSLNGIPSRLLLDFSAAPGGKTTLLLDLAHFEDVIVANEPHPERVNLLLENVAKWGFPNCIVTQSPPKRWDKIPPIFDVVLVDAPCSGEGLWRRSGYSSWSPGWVKKCALRQRHILTSSVPLLKEGGIFLYSTCTYEYEENEEQITWLSSQWEWESVAFHPPKEWKWELSVVKGNLNTYRLYPHKVEGEGFFLAPLVFKSTWGEEINFPKRLLQIEIKPIFPPIPYFLPAESYFLWEDQIVFTTVNAIRVATYLQKKGIRVRQVGIPVLDLRYEVLLPHSFLAYKSLLNIPKLSLSYEEAIDYLKGDISFLQRRNLKESSYLGISYEGITLGGIKKAGNRFRILFPKSWSARHYLKEL